MDTDNLLYVIKVSFPLFTRRFHFGNECMICRKKKKLRKVEVVMNHYNSASLNLDLVKLC